MTLDLAAFQAWIGRQEIVEETLRPEPSAALSALLDRDDAPGPGDPLPALWHWIHCLPMHRQSDIAEDGHTRRGGFVPPIALPQRMFAGARLRFPKALRLGGRAGHHRGAGHRLSRPPWPGRAHAGSAPRTR